MDGIDISQPGAIQFNVFLIKSVTDERERFFKNFMCVQRFENWLGGAGKWRGLVKEGVELIGLGRNPISKRGPGICILGNPRQELARVFKLRQAGRVSR